MPREGDGAPADTRLIYRWDALDGHSERSACCVFMLMQKIWMKKGKRRHVGHHGSWHQFHKTPDRKL